MNEWTIMNATIIDSGQLLKNGYIYVQDGRIIKTGLMSGFCSATANTLDAKGQFISPAYIDMHTHGALLFDAMDATTEALNTMCKFHFAHGVVSFLPTTLTAPLDDVQRLVDLLRSYQPPVPVQLPGIHMEGPFLSKANRGAQPEEFLLCPNDAAMDFMARNRAAIRLITVSPDVSDITRLITWCRTHGIVVSGGHDAAIDDEVVAARAAGMTGVTHIYCCSSTVSRRAGSPRKHLGLTELALLDDGMYVEAIADNCHLPPDLLRLLYKVKGFQQICLVSDSIRATGMVPGQYLLGGNENGVLVTVTPEIALLAERNLFAGSITPIDRMVQNAVSAGIPLAEAVAMASENPARILGLADLGHIAAGYTARLNLLDADGKLLAVLADGHCYPAEDML